MPEENALDNVRPWRFGILVAPNAILINGIFSGVLSGLLRQQGVSEDRIGLEISIITLPSVIYLLWGPITDFIFRRRTWVIIGSLLGGLLTASAFLTRHLAATPAVLLMFLAAVCVQLLPAALGGLMGNISSAVARRKASGYYQATSLMSSSLITGGVLLASKHLSVASIGLSVGAVVALLALPALTIPEPAYQPHPDGLKKALVEIVHEFRATIVRWEALPYIALLAAPISSGAIMSLMPGLAPDYNVSTEQVAWINGFGGGVLVALGAYVVTLLPRSVRATRYYIAFGLLNAGSLLFLWLGPQSPISYFISAPLYLFTIGASYALFTAVLLDVMGRSGRSGSTRYGILNGLGNIPPVYMPALDGLGYKLWGPRGLSAMEAVVCAAASLGIWLWLAIAERNSTPSQHA